MLRVTFDCSPSIFSNSSLLLYQLAKSFHAPKCSRVNIGDIRIYTLSPRILNCYTSNCPSPISRYLFQDPIVSFVFSINTAFSNNYGLARFRTIYKRELSLCFLSYAFKIKLNFTQGETTMAGGIEKIPARFHSVYLSKCHVLPIVSQRGEYKDLTKNRAHRRETFQPPSRQ